MLPHSDGKTTLFIQVRLTNCRSVVRGGLLMLLDVAGGKLGVCVVLEVWSESPASTTHTIYKMLQSISAK